METGPPADDTPPDVGPDDRARRRVVVTRPADQAADLAAELADHGIEALAAPMLTVEALTPAAPIPETAQAILVTSGNGAEGAARLTERRDLPVLAVGEATAEAARAAGFRAVSAASGDAVGLVAHVSERCRPADGPLVWVSGAAISTDLTAELGALGFRVERRVAYRTILAEALPPAVVQALRERSVEGVLFFSPRSAEAFARLIVEADLVAECADVAAYCMSDAIARAASKLAWRAIHVAETPSKAALVGTLVRPPARQPSGGTDRGGSDGHSK